jgi:hypothetical protein
MAKKKKKKVSVKKKRKVLRRAKRVVKKARKKIKKAAVTKIKKPKEKIIGIVTHYFPKVMAGVVKLKAPLSVGDKIKIKGHTTDFTQEVTSMQIDHVPITKGKIGDEIGLLVNSRVRTNDRVYKA